MRFPLSLTRSLTGYLLKQKLAGRQRFPLVLMLEPLHACNLSCAGCGRIREYSDTVGSRLSLEECLAAIDECGAPVVSIAGGEPLIYPEIAELVRQTTARKKHVYLCTNGLKLEEKLEAFQASSRLFINVHLDGMEATHDRLVQREGTFAAATRGISAATAAGFQVTTNTTIYRDTDIHEIAVLLEYLAALGVGGFMVSPAYGYQAVAEDDPHGAKQMFMTRDEIQAKFRLARRLLGRFRLTASPVYLEFLCGERHLDCAAWASPTRNIRGWRGPCYLVADEHYADYRQLVEATDWGRLGPGRDPRCEHCLVHCGFEPAAVLAANGRLRDMMKMAVWQFT
jgi:hopanoid biosynthesis associated radical SAM protein HpnH